MSISSSRLTKLSMVTLDIFALALKSTLPVITSNNLSHFIVPFSSLFFACEVFIAVVVIGYEELLIATDPQCRQHSITLWLFDSHSPVPTFTGICFSINSFTVFAFSQKNFTSQMPRGIKFSKKHLHNHAAWCNIILSSCSFQYYMSHF